MMLFIRHVVFGEWESKILVLWKSFDNLLFSWRLQTFSVAGASMICVKEIDVI